MPSIESFLVLEDSLTIRLSNAFKRRNKETIENIDKALKDKDFPMAYHYVTQLTYLGIDEEDDYIKFILGSAFLLGQSFVTPIDKTAAREDGLPNDIIDIQANSLRQELEQRTTDKIQTEANGMVASLEEVEFYPKEDEPSSFIDGVMKGSTVVLTSLFVSRMITYGFLVQSEIVGDFTYQVSEILDKKTCPVCRVMHGKTFTVRKSLTQIETILRTVDSQEVAGLAPFPSHSKAGVEILESMSEQELEDAGWSTPPYHPACRGTLVKDGTIKVNTSVVQDFQGE